MPTTTITHKFTYSKKDIEELIKADIALQLNAKISQSIVNGIHFKIDMENDPSDWRAEYPETPVFKGVDVKVEVLG